MTNDQLCWHQSSDSHWRQYDILAESNPSCHVHLKQAVVDTSYCKPCPATKTMGEDIVGTELPGLLGIKFLSHLSPDSAACFAHRSNMRQVGHVYRVFGPVREKPKCPDSGQWCRLILEGSTLESAGACSSRRGFSSVEAWDSVGLILACFFQGLSLGSF